MGIFDRAQSPRPVHEQRGIERLARSHPDQRVRAAAGRVADRQAQLVVDEVIAEVAEEDQHRRGRR